MESSKPTPLWLHVARILTLVIAAAGVAWVVASVQRRANRAFEERQSVVDISSPSEDVNIDHPDEFPELVEIEAEIARYEHPRIEIDRPSLAAPAVGVPLQYALPEVPALKLNLDQNLSALFFDELSPILADPYIGSSKSMVFSPSTFRPTRRDKRHGKP